MYRFYDHHGRPLMEIALPDGPRGELMLQLIRDCLDSPASPCDAMLALIKTLGVIFGVSTKEDGDRLDVERESAFMKVLANEFVEAMRVGADIGEIVRAQHRHYLKQEADTCPAPADKPSAKRARRRSTLVEQPDGVH